jgi:Retroviral aspartyl protease
MLIGQEQVDSSEFDCTEAMKSDLSAPTEEAVVSMYANHSNPYTNTMRFKGKLGDKDVFALLDSGSTHSFVDPSVLIGQHCQVINTNPLIVMVANGSKMVTYSKCTNLQFSLQGHEFTGELRLL